jgi:hypothetical protein
MEPFSTRRYPHSEISTGEHLTKQVTAEPLATAVRGLYRSRMLGRDERGHIITAEGQAVAKLMRENAERHAREKLTSDGLEIPEVFGD